MGSNCSCLRSKTYEQDISIVNESQLQLFRKIFNLIYYSQ